MPAFAISSAFLKPCASACSWVIIFTHTPQIEQIPLLHRDGDFFLAFWGLVSIHQPPIHYKPLQVKFSPLLYPHYIFIFLAAIIITNHYNIITIRHYFSKWQKPLFTFKASTSLRYTNQYLLYGHTSFFSTFLQQIWLPYLNKGLRCIPEAFALV